MQHSLYKYFIERRWADAFLDGEILFRSLAYFRDYEDENVRKDGNEGNSVFRPSGGLLITNHTKGTQFTMPEWAFESTANQEEILVFCASRSLTDELRQRFGAAACVEILKIPTLCERIKRVLPADTTFFARRVDYYDDCEGPEERWALPDLIATSKFRSYQWQNEFRIIFCETDALGFEKGATRLIKRVAEDPAKLAEHRQHLLKAGSLRDICKLQVF